MSVVVSAPETLTRDSEGPSTRHYSLVLRNNRTGRALFESVEQWQTSFFSVGPDDSRTRAFWSADSQMVALVYEGVIHTQLLRLFCVTRQGADEVPLPDYVHPVLAALNTRIVKSFVAKPIGWTEHALELSLSGTTDEPRDETKNYDFDYSTILKVRRENDSVDVQLSALHDKLVAQQE